MKIYTLDGERLYLNEEERSRFERFAFLQDRKTMTFALMLFYTGCRVSEARALRNRDIDLSKGTVTFMSLKKRKNGVFRQVPISLDFASNLNLVHAIRESKPNEKLWSYSRPTGWRKIARIMKEANIEGPQASPKGLRHSFGVHAVAKAGIPLNLVQRWLGHADLRTTSIYANALGEEERTIAERMWS